MLKGTNLKANFHYGESNAGKFLNMSMESTSKLKQTSAGERGSNIDFSSFEGEYFNIGLLLNGECPMITGSGIMIGNDDTLGIVLKNRDSSDQQLKILKVSRKIKNESP